MGVVSSGERAISSEELAVRGARVAAGLEGLGIGAGDGVALYLRNDLAFFEAAIGASLVGAYPVAVNWHYTEDEARFVLEDSESKAIVIHADLLDGVRGAIGDGVHVLAVPTPPEVLEAYGIPGERGVVPAGVTNWDEWRERFTPRLQEPSGTRAA